MIEALKDEAIVHKVGGRFKLTSLIQHRVRELMDGARPLVERDGRSDIEVAIAEIVEEKITIMMPDEREEEEAMQAEFDAALEQVQAEAATAVEEAPADATEEEAPAEEKAADSA